MRLPPILPETLSAELRQVHDGIASLVTEKQNRITIFNEEGALIGPFPAMLHFPQFGVQALLLHRSLAAAAALPKGVREVAILTVGAAFGARYQIYAHEITAAEAGLSPSKVATLAAGGRPPDLTDQEAIVFDVSKTLVSGRTLQASTYERAIGLVGREGIGELAFLVGGYSLIAMILNCFDVPVPGQDAKKSKERV